MTHFHPISSRARQGFESLRKDALGSLAQSLAAIVATDLPVIQFVHTAVQMQQMVSSHVLMLPLTLPHAILFQPNATVDALPPPMCRVAYVAGNSSFNSYPSRSYVHAYNLRRIMDTTTVDEVCIVMPDVKSIHVFADSWFVQPDLDYVKELILAEPYPPSSGSLPVNNYVGRDI